MPRKKRTGNERKLTIEINPQLLEDFHVYALKQRKTLRELIESSIKEMLELAGTYSPARPYKPLLERLLAEGKHTRAEIAETVFEKVPGTKKDTVLQFLSDAKTRPLLPWPIVETERRKCLGFGEPWAASDDGHAGQDSSPNDSAAADG